MNSILRQNIPSDADFLTDVHLSKIVSDIKSRTGGFLLFHILERVITFFAGSDLYDIFNVIYEDFTIADITRIQCFLNRVDHGFHGYPANNDIDLNLRKQPCFYR